MAKVICTSCKKEIVNEKSATRFMCPNCGKTEIARCKHCRAIGARYTCSSCEFTGPN